MGFLLGYLRIRPEMGSMANAHRHIFLPIAACHHSGIQKPARLDQRYSYRRRMYWGPAPIHLVVVVAVLAQLAANTSQLGHPTRILPTATLGPDFAHTGIYGSVSHRQSLLFAPGPPKDRTRVSVRPLVVALFASILLASPTAVSWIAGDRTTAEQEQNRHDSRHMSSVSF